jgi:hypothetical protein
MSSHVGENKIFYKLGSRWILVELPQKKVLREYHRVGVIVNSQGVVLYFGEYSEVVERYRKHDNENAVLLEFSPFDSLGVLNNLISDPLAAEMLLSMRETDLDKLNKIFKAEWN